MIDNAAGRQNISDIAAKIKQAVIDAAEYLTKALGSGKPLELNYKSDSTLVMNLDLESQRIILQHLQDSYPIVAEEDPASHARISEGGSYFLVDPLDGTTSCKRFLGQRGGHVGYGPLVGFVHQGELVVAAFFSIPHRRLFMAVSGQGTTMTDFGDDFRSVQTAKKLVAPECLDLKQAGMLFFISQFGEASVVEYLRKQNAIENIYRFGGFASDCARLAQGYEQIQIQFAVKPWDFAAVLLAAEAGCEVFCDPLKRRVPLKQWRIEHNNPVVTVASKGRTALFELLDRMK
ncbi:MAG: inositol monophosphatase family protein [Pseudomonadota bacterium]|jgi:fructose-1,6-bisphosphatase/inositol monophosphatase family enzyme